MAALGLHPIPCQTSSPSPHESSLLCSSKGSYELLNAVSRGSYGVVYRARDTKTGRIVAVKLEFHGLSQTTLREISILSSLPHHPSIVEHKDTIIDYPSRRVAVVMDYLPSDLKRLMDSMRSQPFTLSQVKWLMKQLLEGVAFLHEYGVMHRDLKPSNILIDKDKGDLKICDFGLSRLFDRKGSGLYTRGVVTLWYRAPELLLGANEYSCAIDMWSVGCIMGELLLGEVLFRGRSELEQLGSMFMVLGAPDDVAWPEFSTLVGSRILFSSVKVRPCNKTLRLKFATAAAFSGAPSLTELGFDLIEKLLMYDPQKRITAREALEHGWFREY